MGNLKSANLAHSSLTTLGARTEGMTKRPGRNTGRRGTMIDQPSLDRDTIILVVYNIKTIVSKHWDGIGEDDEKWRH